MAQRSRRKPIAPCTQAIDFNRGMAALSGDPEVVGGVGTTSVLGGQWDQAEGRSKELRELFR